MKTPLESNNLKTNFMEWIGKITYFQVIGCIYYIVLTSFLNDYLNDMTLVILLGIPAALSVIPAFIFIKDVKHR